MVQSVHAKPQRHLDLSTLISFFEKEKENVQKELAPNTTAKEVSELKNFYRILELDKTESLIKHLTADPALCITTILESKQLKDPLKLYAVSVATGHFTTTLYGFDTAFRTVIDHRTTELMRLAKKDFVVARLETIDQYQKELT